MLLAPEVSVRSTELDDEATRLGRLVGAFGSHVERLLRRYQEEIIHRQYQMARLADAAIELYVSGCVLSRLNRLLSDSHLSEANRRDGLKTGRYYLLTARRRIRASLAALWDNYDESTTALARTTPFSEGQHKPTSIDVLALSGGGAEGAFGAGLLVGWTEAGNRPEFSIISGTSSGALIAPFAFLGAFMTQP